MAEEQVLSRGEQEQEYEEALRTLQRGLKTRGDSFDIGSSNIEEQPTDLISNFLANPRQMAGSLNLSPKQAENVRSLIVGGGTGAIHKFLSQHLGDEFSAALGGLISGYIAKRLIGR